jgi:signal transduction histidine kinase
VSLPPTLDLAAYRIVQEGLTNVRKHAGDARTSVSVHYGENHLDVEVRNGGEIAIASGGGHGLIGIRERVTLLGGDLESGPAENGGFVLRARLPLAGDSR